MNIQFEIEGIFRIQSRNKVCVSARLLNSNLNWSLSDKSKLGEVEIEKWFDIPRAIDKDGKQRLDLFTFAMKHNEDETKLQVNQIVELVP